MTSPAGVADEILAIPDVRTNAELIARVVVPLGYLREEWTVVDPTWGLGRFWSLWQPRTLLGSDLVPSLSPTGTSIDMAALPYADRSADAEVIDGPYKLNGTSSGKGGATSDESYGVHLPASRDERHDTIKGGITEAARVLRPGGMLLVKCQNQINGARYWSQQRIFTAHAEGVGFELVDELHLRGHRSQPRRGTCVGCGEAIVLRTTGRWHRWNRGAECGVLDAGHEPAPGGSVQQHALHNYSTLLVLRRTA